MRPADSKPDEVLAFWQRRSLRRLQRGDARQIAANMTGFFRVLLDWEKRERMEAKADKIEGSDANDQDEGQ